MPVVTTDTEGPGRDPTCARYAIPRPDIRAIRRSKHLVTINEVGMFRNSWMTTTGRDLYETFVRECVAAYRERNRNSPAIPLWAFAKNPTVEQKFQMFGTLMGKRLNRDVHDSTVSHRVLLPHIEELLVMTDVQSLEKLAPGARENWPKLLDRHAEEALAFGILTPLTLALSTYEASSEVRSAYADPISHAVAAMQNRSFVQTLEVAAMTGFGVLTNDFVDLDDDDARQARIDHLGLAGTPLVKAHVVSGSVHYQPSDEFVATLRREMQMQNRGGLKGDGLPGISGEARSKLISSGCPVRNAGIAAISRFAGEELGRQAGITNRLTSDSLIR